MDGFEKVPIVDGSVAICKTWLTPDESRAWFQGLRQEVPWEQSVIRIYGRDVAIPRLNAYHGDPGAIYTWSRTRFEPGPWTPTLTAIRARVEATLDSDFNSVLVNLYRDGSDSMGWHADDEPELGDFPLIASVSLGAVRRFSLRHRFRRDIPPIHLEPPDGSLIVMSGSTQSFWRHQVPKTKRPVGPRINLTYRQIRVSPK